MEKIIFEAPTNWKHDGEYYEMGEKFEVDKETAKLLPDEYLEVKIVESDDGLEDLSESELYKIMQDLDINPRTRIREQGEEAMIESIRKAREGEE